MIKEIIETGRSIEKAVEAGCIKLGVTKDDITVEIIDLPKKGFLGIGASLAKVKIVFDQQDMTKSDMAKEFLQDILNNMGVDVFDIQVSEKEEGINIKLEGENLGFIIGRRGETLDAIQYLVGLVVNRIDDTYTRVTIDSGSFREKREVTLSTLASKIARNTKKTGKSFTLEPMNPYERRIIHAAVGEIEGVLSKSIGDEPNRRVIISSKTPIKKYPPKRPYQAAGDKNFKDVKKPPFKNDGDKRPYNNTNSPKPYVQRYEDTRKTTEDNVRSVAPKESEGKPLYSKFEVTNKQD